VKKRLFYVRRQTCADGSFGWYVLNGHTLRRAGKPFPTRAEAEAERAKLQTKLDLARRKSSGERRKVDADAPHDASDRAGAGRE
jgi:hypothetical protein